MAETQLRIALLIDADNAPAEMIDEILTELSTFGLINIRRAYGNWTKAGLKAGNPSCWNLRCGPCSSSTIPRARTRPTWP
jgi:hypothetical protein